MYVYCLRNRLAGCFLNPFVEPVAKDLYPKVMQRSIVFNPAQAKAQHLYESDLYFLGTFNSEEGTFDLLEKPEFLCTFSNLEVNNDA